MKKITLLALCLLSIQMAHAEKNYLGILQSVSVYAVTLKSDAILKTVDQDKEILTFSPNVSTGIGISLETEYLAIGYTFAGEKAENPNHEESSFRDLRFNFRFEHFDFRLNSQKYEGALVEDGGQSSFYNDYYVKSENMRAHYYWKDKYLDIVRDGRKQTHKVSKNGGFDTLGTWFLGVNLDKRNIILPDNLISAHQNLINSSGINYNTQFSSLSWGPLIGYDAFLQASSFFLRLKLAIGSAFQSEGEKDSTGQYELAFNTGFSLGKNHLLSLGVDVYSMNFVRGNQKLDNSNADVRLTYNYAF